MPIGALGLQALGVAIAPQMSRLLARSADDDARSVFRLATWWVIIASWPAFFLIVCFSPLLMRLFGNAYGSGATALTILALGMLVQTGTGSNGIVLLMSGRSSWSLAISVVSLATNLALNFLLIPHLGIDGAAVAWAVTIFVNNGVTTVLVWRLVGINPFGGGFVVALVVSAIFAGVSVAARLLLGATVPGFFLALGVALPVGVVVVWRARGVWQLGAFRNVVGSGPTDCLVGTP